MQAQSPAASGLDARVAIARSPRAEYGTLAEAALRCLFTAWRLDAGRLGTPEWNPLGALIPAGARVVVKPNWVLHYNQAGAGLECLITHPSVLEAVLEYLARTRPAEVVIGDAPVQSCNFEALLQFGEVEAMVQRFCERGINVRLADFRRTVLHGNRLADRRTRNRSDLSAYVLFDLGSESLLEALSDDAGKFRVTMYDPDLLRRAHQRGRHQYLVAREVVDADVVINLPKLKTHKKACLTGALKNLVGINGNKEFLPHHRKGGAGRGGDCYPGNSWLKGWAEDLLDAANRRSSRWSRVLLGKAAEGAARGACLLGADNNLEGSWHGNETVWRTCLDLQRILHYGQADATLARGRRRLVITITDAIVAGEGEGPLANTPVAAGFLTGALNTAAAEWVHARLMGFDPRRIPLVREAFGRFSHPLADFEPSSIRVLVGERELDAQELTPAAGRVFRAPEGWRGHCELSDRPDDVVCEQTVVA